MSRTLASTAALLLGLAAPVFPQDISLTSKLTRWRISAEHFSVDANENLGLVGVHLDVLEPFRAVPDVFVGAGGYAAVVGNRGGLVLGGLTLGYTRELWEHWNVELAVFAGGGGGGGGQEFDGFVYRPHVALEREIGLLALRVELAKLEQPDGELDDTHLAFGFTLPSELLLARETGRSRLIPDEALIERKIRISPAYLVLDPDSGSQLDSGPATSDIEMLGIRLDYFVSDFLFFPVEAYGAIDGGADGFAMGMAGIGTSWPTPWERARVELRGLVGTGGGGGVSTGGGYLWQARAGIAAELIGNLSLELGGGLTSFPDGDFDATTWTAGIGWSSRSPELSLDYPRSRLLREGVSGEDAQVTTSRFQLLNKIYSPPSSAVKKDGSEYDSALSLIGLGFEQPVSGRFALTGRAFSAYDGDVGGYAEGLLGAKYEVSPFGDDAHSFSVTGEAGAGGGGGVDVGDGLIFHLSAGYRFAFGERLSFLFDIGKVEASDGSFEGESYTFGLAWHLPRAYFR